MFITRRLLREIRLFIEDFILYMYIFYFIKIIFDVLSHLRICKRAIEKLPVYNSVKRFRFNPGTARQRISVERRRISEQDT